MSSRHILPRIRILLPIPPLAQLLCFLNCGHTQEASALVEECLAHRDGAVAVAVSLDDGKDGQVIL